MLKTRNVTLAVLVCALLLATPVLAKVNLVYGFKGDQGELQVAKDIVKSFNASHADIEVEILDLTAGGDWVNKLTVLFAAGTPPDVIRMEYQRSIGFIADGLLYPLNDLTSKDTSFKTKEFFPVALTAHTVGGKLYAIPQEAQPFTMFVNKTRLAEAGIPFPGLDWTIDELMSYARKTTLDANNDGTPELYGWVWDSSITRVEPLLMAFGARFLNETRTKAALDSPQALQALNFLATAAVQYKVRGGNFQQGSAVFYNTAGPWMVPGYRTAITGWDWDILPVPGGPGGRGTTLGSDGYHIAAGSKHPEAAWEFVKYITSTDSVALMSKRGNLFPARQAPAVAYVKTKPADPPLNLQAYLKGIEIAQPTQVFPQFINADRAVGQVLPRIWNGQISVNAAVNDLTTQINAMLK